MQELINADLMDFRREFFLAGGLGFEPRFSDPKSDVLPLDDPPTGLHDKA